MSAGARREDARFLTGQGAYADDRLPEDTLFAAFVRAPVARGRLRALDLSGAAAMPGVRGAFAAADLEADGLTEMPGAIEPRRADGGPVGRSPRPVLSGGEVRHLGEPLAMIVADSRAAAEDAAAAVLPEIEEAAPVLPWEAGRAAPVWPEIPDDIAALHRAGDAAAAEAAFAGAAHVVETGIDVSRVAALPLETRAALGRVAEDGRLELLTSTQKPHDTRAALARLFGCAEARVRVRVPDVGGGFGMKGALYREEALVLWAAQRLGAPVAWRSGRSEAFLADDHGRAVRGRVRLALDAAGRFLALDARLEVDAGAYFSQRSMGMLANLAGIAGTYRLPAIAAEITFRHSSTVPICPYRGAGRPEATYAVERAIDAAARRLGKDPVALRRCNLVPPEAMPFRTALGAVYDCGDFARVLNRAEALAAVADFPRRRAEAQGRGRLRGLGMAMPVEIAGGPARRIRPDSARMTAMPDGAVVLAVGAVSVGQGLETAFTRLAAERLDLDPARLVYRQGDTDLVADGRGSGGSAALAVGGPAVAAAADALLAAARAAAAEALDVPGDAVRHAAGVFTAEGSNRSVTLAELAARAGGAGLSGSAEFRPDAVTYPNGCHFCEVELDPETGRVQVLAYTAVEDVGRVLNPALVAGQMHGGIAQGLGQALGERIVIDPAGQILTGSFMDYPLPRAADMPAFRLETVEVPTAVNPLGVKGVGEAGTVGALAAAMNAVSDALWQAGVDTFDMPATPARVWKAIASRQSAFARPLNHR